MGVADVLIKPIEEQVARTLFLDDLMRCVVIVIQEVMKLDGLGDLNIPEHLLHRFVIGLRDSYHRSNPYHNFAHAVDVLQATFYFLCRMGKLPQSGKGYPPLLVEGFGAEERSTPSEPSTHIPHDNDTANNNSNEDTFKPIRIQDFLRPEDIFALIVASIGHDVGHPGVNNMFLVNAHTPLAQVYNDRSVLESFHSMALFQVMKKHGFECFDVDSQNRKFMEFRKMVVSTILATDMGLHFDYVGKIKEQTERLRLRNTPEGSIPKPNQASIDEQERLVLCGTLIKCADISNASRPFHVAERWSAVLLQEMCNQADIEKEMAVCSGGPVPTGPTKNLANDQGMQIDSQLGFIHGFAMPLFTSVKAMIPEMDYCVDLLQINHKIWEERKTEYLKNGENTLISLMNVIPTNHSNSLSGPKPSTQAKRSHGRSRTHTGKNSLLPKTDGNGVTTNGDGPHAPKSQTQVRRGPHPNAIANGTSESGVSNSSIPRPRPRTKAVTSEGNVVHGAYGSGDTKGQHLDNNSPNNRAQHERQSTREASRARSVTSSQSPAIPDGTPITPSGRQTPSRQSNSRGQKSPGRRNGQSHHNNHYAKDKVVASVGSHVGGLSHLDKVEPIVLGSLLPIPGLPALDHSGSDTSSSIPSSPSLPTSSPSTSPNSKGSHPGKATPRHSPSPLPMS
ncbi:3',5'-cyclic-nucleotide phosphodiesterase [Podila clonocystis]|nr:3',5'-cyclic-nucleotide phosphodiesterase [Podila clonocystis]